MYGSSWVSSSPSATLLPTFKVILSPIPSFTLPFVYKEVGINTSESFSGSLPSFNFTGNVLRAFYQNKW